jgi:hypothetical protein
VDADVGTEHGAQQLAQLTRRAREQAAAAADEAIRQAARDAGVLVASCELYINETADVLEQLAQQLGASDAVAAVWQGLDEGMAAARNDTPETPESSPRPSAPAAPSDEPRGAFRDFGESDAAVAAFACARLHPDPGGRVSSVQMSEVWERWDGRPVRGHGGSLTAAVAAWAAAGGLQVGRFRFSRHVRVGGDLNLTSCQPVNLHGQIWSIADSRGH